MQSDPHRSSGPHPIRLCATFPSELEKEYALATDVCERRQFGLTDGARRANPALEEAPTMSAKPIIFISYAPADEPEKPRGEEVKSLSFVMKFLRPAVKGGEFTTWVDRHTRGGAVWEKEIEDKLRACDIFVLLVSPSSMASTYIIETEIRIVRERQAAGHELRVYPLLLRPTPASGLNQVCDFNLCPRDAPAAARRGG